MPLVTIETIAGALSAEQKRRLISNVTEAVVAVEGEALRDFVWVRLQEFEEGDWAVGGKLVRTADLDRLRTRSG